VTLGFSGPVRDFLSSAWYNDAARIAALLPIIGVPAAAMAIIFVLEAVEKRLQSERLEWRDNRRNTEKALVLTLIILFVFFGARGSAVPAQLGWAEQLFEVTDDSPLLTPDEVSLLKRLSEQLPEDAVIVGDPWTGTAFAWAVADRRVIFAHFGTEYPDLISPLAGDFKTLGSDLCPLIEQLHVTHFLEFEPEQYIVEDWSRPFIQLHNIGGSPILREIDREGDAALFEVTC